MSPILEHEKTALEWSHECKQIRPKGCAKVEIRWLAEEYRWGAKISATEWLTLRFCPFCRASLKDELYKHLKGSTLSDQEIAANLYSPCRSRADHIAKVQAEEDPAYTGDYFRSSWRDPSHHIAWCQNTTLDDDHPTRAAILAGHLSLRDAEDLQAKFSPEYGILYGTIGGWIKEKREADLAKDNE